MAGICIGHRWHRESGEAMRASETNSACVPLCLWLLREATATATWQKYLFICLAVFLRLSAGMWLASTPSTHSWPPPAAVCACVSRLRLGLPLCGASSGARFVVVVVVVVVLTRSPFCRHDLLDSRVRDSLLAALFAQLRPSTPPRVPPCHGTRHSAVGRASRPSLTSLASLSLGACVSFIYDYLCTTCFVFIACRCR